MKRALLLDFDGVVLDTESADFEACRLLFERHDAELPRARWLAAIGTDARTSFDPYAFLRDLRLARGDPEVEIESLRAERRRIYAELRTGLRVLPGVADWIDAAREHGLALAIASSSPSDWIDEHLRHAGLEHAFDAVVTRDHVERAKPSPDLYLRALDTLGADASRSLAVEDSPNGVTAAVAAGIFCVAVPGPMTRDLDLSHAQLRLQSLAERGLASVLEIR